MQLAAAHRRWLIVNAIAVTTVVNVVLNALPAWASTRDMDEVPLWTVPFTGGTGVYTDTLGTLVILPFVTTLLCSAAVARERRNGLPPVGDLPLALVVLPEPLLWRALCFSVLTAGLLAAPFAAALALTVPDGMSTDAFVAYKTALGVGLGFVVTPLVALRAMLAA